MINNKTERITSIEEKIAQLQNQKKQLLQQHKLDERKARTKRLCKRAGLLESMLPDTIILTDEQFETFLKRTTANDYGREKLSEIISPKPEPNNEVSDSASEED